MHRIDCNRRIRLAHTRRMLLPHAQHCHVDVQRTYILQKDATTIMPRHQDRTESNQITPAKQPPKHRCVCQPQSKSNQNQIPSRQTASNTRIVITVSTASHVQFVIPIGIPKRSVAGSSVCTTKRSCRCRCRCRCRTYNHNMLQVSQ